MPCVAEVVNRSLKADCTDFTYAMIDFKITFQTDELLNGDYEKLSMISEIMFRKFLR